MIPDPTPDPDPEPEYPTQLPDPGDPDSPEEITILDDGVPKTYVKVWDPAEEEWVYILEEDVPLMDMVPRTGDISPLWYLTTLLSACGLAFLVLRKKNRG